MQAARLARRFPSDLSLLSSFVHSCQPTLDITGKSACATKSKSLVAERHHRVHARSATRGNVACRERDRSQKRRHAHKRQQISRAYAEEQRGKQSREAKRSCDSNRDAQDREFCT